MLTLNRILVPIAATDSSAETDATPETATSRRLMQQAAWLARRFQAEIILLHVVTPLSYPMGFLESGHEITSRDLQAHIIQSAQHDLDRTLGPEFEGITVTRKLLRGNPAREIVNVARDEGVGLIVMATHGHGAVYRFLLGSVTAKVLHESSCPVWTGAHLEEATVRGFAASRFLCSVNLTPHNRHTLSLAAEFAVAVGATLTLVHVTPSVEIYGPGGLHVDTEWKEKLVGYATDQISKLQQEVGTHADVIIESGNVPQALNRVADRVQADVLVLGHTPGRSHLGDNGEGYGLIRESHIPVLSV